MNDIRVLNFYQMIFIFPIKSSTGSTVTFALFNVYRHSCYIFINTSLLCLNTNFGKYPLRYREYFPLQKVFCVLQLEYDKQLVEISCFMICKIDPLISCIDLFMLGVQRSHFMVILIPLDSIYGEHRLLRDQKYLSLGLKMSDLTYVLYR